LALALVRDMRVLRQPSDAEEIQAFETDVLAGFVLARAAAGALAAALISFSARATGGLA